MTVTLSPAKKGISRYNLASIAENWLKFLFSGSNAIKSMNNRRLGLGGGGCALEVAIGCTVNCRASAIIYKVLELMAIIN